MVLGGQPFIFLVGQVPKSSAQIQITIHAPLTIHKATSSLDTLSLCWILGLVVETQTLSLARGARNRAGIASVSTVQSGGSAGEGVLWNDKDDVGGAAALLHIWLLFDFLFQELLELLIILHSLHLAGALERGHGRGELVVDLHELWGVLGDEHVHLEEGFFECFGVVFVFEVVAVD